MARTLREIRDHIDQLIREEEKVEELRIMTIDEIEEEVASLGLEFQQALMERKLKAAEQAAFSPSGSPDSLPPLPAKRHPRLGRPKKPEDGV